MCIVLSYHCAANPKDLKLMAKLPKGRRRQKQDLAITVIMKFSSSCASYKELYITSNKEPGQLWQWKNISVWEVIGYFSITEQKSQLLSQYNLEYTKALSVPFPVYAGTKGHTVKSIRLPNSTHPKWEIRWIAFWHIYLTLARLIFILLLLGCLVEKQ